MPTKKTWQDKLHVKNDLPKIVKLDKNAATKWGGDTMYIPCPEEVDQLMRQVPDKKLTTTNNLRSHLAKTHKTAITCPLTTGIFTWISANAAAEINDKTNPYWRTLKTNGEVNPKYPGGIEKNIALLKKEGHKIIKKGKKYFVLNYTDSLYKF